MRYYDNNTPASLQALFTKSNYTYNLRRKMTYMLPKPKTDFLKKSISYQAAVLWNSLDNSTRAMENFADFKKTLKKFNM